MSDFNETEMQDETLTFETHSEADEKAFLNEMSGAANDDEFDPSGIEQDDKANQERELMLEAASESAVMALGVAEVFVQEYAHPDFAFDERLAEKFGKAAAPLLLKYGGEMPPWMMEYKEEFGFVCAAGLLGFASFKQIKALKAQDAANEAKEDGEEAA